MEPGNPSIRVGEGQWDMEAGLDCPIGGYEDALELAEVVEMQATWT